MDFISWKFILFFIAAMLILLPCYRYKKAALICCNIVFLFSAGGQNHNFIILVLFGIISFLGAWTIERHRTGGVLAAVLLLSLSPLLFFKYTDFLCNTVLQMRLETLSEIKSPLGISFYTFQGIGYLIDVYKKKVKPVRNFLDYMIYLSLFTCVASGPINRSKAMLEQIEEYKKSSFEYERCKKGFQYVLLGLFLKVFIAGRMAMLVTTPYSNIETSQGLVLLTASVGYTIQIFCDFCGYSYMAYGFSKIIGLEVMQNFRMPYAAKTITEFWRRWHISLSSWLTEYVYIPLGGSRCSKFRSNRNVLITFAVSGLWHGANVTFLIWGILNGLLIVIERGLGFVRDTKTKTGGFLHWALTMASVHTMGIFFRASTLGDAVKILVKILRETIPNLFAITSASDLAKIQVQMGVTFYELCMIVLAGIAFLLFEFYVDRKEEVTDIFQKKPAALRWCMYLMFLTVTLIFGVTGKASEFIYVQF